jgi:hypothetical protein
MSHASSTITLCRYWVKPEREAEFRALLDRHWPTFRRLGLVADRPAHLIFRGVDEARGVYYVETFPWKDAASAGVAHEHPEVGAIWGPMAECCTSMEFPSVELVEAS